MVCVLEILGAPAGAYCTIGTGQDANDITRPGSIVYFWKSGSFENGSLVLAFEIPYSWMYNSTVVEESGNSHLCAILTDHMDGMAHQEEIPRLSFDAVLP